MADYASASTSRQAVFFFTGSIAGICSSSADFAFDRASSAVRGTAARPLGALIRGSLPHIVKPGIRFWGFDLAKTSISADLLPVSVRGGLSGAAGGALEMSLTNVYHYWTANSLQKRPSILTAIRTTALHSGKLFLCFGSYTYLANTFSEELPPRPFPYCLCLGALAGAFGTTLISPFELYSGTRAPLRLGSVLRTALSRAPRGGVGVGTVIAVQVTSSAWFLGEL